MSTSQQMYASISPEVLVGPNGTFDARPTNNMNRHPVYSFGQYTVSPRTRSISKEGRLVSVGSRAFDLLVLLLSSAGSVISKAEMFEYVWPATAVEESNLRVQMNQVRKVLGSYADAVITIPGRGYFFAAEVAVEWPDAHVRSIS